MIAVIHLFAPKRVCSIWNLPGEKWKSKKTHEVLQQNPAAYVLPAGPGLELSVQAQLAGVDDLFVLVSTGSSSR